MYKWTSKQLLVRLVGMVQFCWLYHVIALVDGRPERKPFAGFVSPL